MNLGVYPLAASMVNQLNRVDVAANNLANMKTAGFKEEKLSEGSFNYYLQRMQEEKKDPNKLSTVVNTVPKIDGRYIDDSVGNITPSSNNLDFAIKEANTYFKVKTKNNQEYFTRDGSFKNQNGFLVTNSGAFVLNNNNQPIPVDNENAFALNIGLFKTDKTNVEKVGSNNFLAKDQNSVTLVPNNGILFQGAVENSNVNSVLSMIKLIEAHRSFEQAQKAITGIGDLSTTLIDKIGNVR